MSEESKELDGNVSTVELLGEVKTAIRKILIGGQSYQIGSRKLTRADLYQLRKLKEEPEAEIAAEGDEAGCSVIHDHVGLCRRLAEGFHQLVETSLIYIVSVHNVQGLDIKFLVSGKGAVDRIGIAAFNGKAMFV